LARREVEALKKQANVSSTDVELAEVRFEKEALETKLRKYAAHCQRLEEDRSGIIDVIKSCDKALMSSGDVHQAVMILCDKVASLEEECESISKGSRSTNIAGAIDKLRRENDTLKASLATSRSSVENIGKPATELSKQLTDSQKLLTSISRERDELKKQVEEARGGANGAESKLRFLEQENLQLMLDLKGKNKQLQRHREELEHLRLKSSVENPTLAFGTIDLMSMNNKALPAGQSVEKPNVKGVRGEVHGKPTPLQDNQRHTRSLTRKKRSSASAEADEKGSPSHVAKENMTKTNRLSKESPAPSSAKKRRFAIPTSGKKQKSQREVPGLGEANIASDDNTGECKQS
jgi:uncharacterized coiled-coil DUF342 family protein